LDLPFITATKIPIAQDLLLLVTRGSATTVRKKPMVLLATGITNVKARIAMTGMAVAKGSVKLWEILAMIALGTKLAIRRHFA